MDLARRSAHTKASPFPTPPPRALAPRTGRAAALLPLGLAALLATVAGHTSAARSLLLGDTGGAQGTAPGPGRVAMGALLTSMLGGLALLPCSVLALTVARGLLYGLVDQGPYDRSWGGPSRAGAWLAHFTVALPIAASALVVLLGLAALQQRLIAPLRGVRRPAWALPTMVLCLAAGGVFVVAFVHQLH